MTHWTTADEAELDVLLYELSSAYADHRPKCAQCRAYDAREPGSTPCEHLRNAIAIVLDWRERRHLLTRAEHARAQHEERAA